RSGRAADQVKFSRTQDHESEIRSGSFCARRRRRRHRRLGRRHDYFLESRGHAHVRLQRSRSARALARSHHSRALSRAPLGRLPPGHGARREQVSNFRAARAGAAQGRPAAVDRLHRGAARHGRGPRDRGDRPRRHRAVERGARAQAPAGGAGKAFRVAAGSHPPGRGAPRSCFRVAVGGAIIYKIAAAKSGASPMYVPAHFSESRVEVLHALIRERPLGILVTFGAEGLSANHLPFEIAPEPHPFGLLRCHVARANPVWRDFSADHEALVIFTGPSTYVSPSWYPSKNESGEVVPTYNYLAAHAYGAMKVVHDAAWLRGLVTRLTERFETGREAPWRVSDAPAAFIEKQLGAIVGIEIP